jgi:hypothetical protein
VRLNTVDETGFPRSPVRRSKTWLVRIGSRLSSTTDQIDRADTYAHLWPTVADSTRTAGQSLIDAAIPEILRRARAQYNCNAEYCGEDRAVIGDRWTRTSAHGRVPTSGTIRGDI